MYGTYRKVFHAPGSAAFAAAAFVMRIPIAVYPIALVLIVSARTGQYGFAGVLSACYIVGGVPGAPLLARLVDRFGQRCILVPTTAVHAASVATIAVLFELDAPNWTLTIPTFLAGFAYLSVGSLVRARWSYVLAGKPELTTAYSLESTLDELIFVIGPLIATLIATHTDPVVVLGVAAVLVTGGAVWLGLQRTTEPPPHAADQPPTPSALRSRGMVLMTVAATGMGGLFAGAEISMVAFCGQQGHRAFSGVALAMFALGSGVSGLFYGSRTWSSGLLDRFRLQAVLFAVLPVLFLLATNVQVLAACAFVAGLGTAPTLITAFGVIQQVVPGAALTEGLTWLVVGLNIGYGTAAALVGRIADAYGARVAFTVCLGAGAVTAVFAQLLHRRLRASRAASRTPVAPSEHAALP